VTPRNWRDIGAGATLFAVGVFASIHAQRYEFGSLHNMGPGFFPSTLGVLLVILGACIAVPACFQPGETLGVAWKPLAWVVASILVFGFALKPLGLVLATMLSVLLSTLADREVRWKSRLLIALGVALLTYLVFSLGLNMVLPLWPGRT
jgi:hypothetical protein